MSEPTLPPPSPPSPPTPSPSPSPAPAPAGRPTSSLAIVSLVCGILGWTLLPFVGSLLAVVCGHMARAEIARSQGGIDGDAMAIAGLVMGWAVILVTVLTILAFVLFFGGLAVLLGMLGMSGQL